MFNTLQLRQTKRCFTLNNQWIIINLKPENSTLNLLKRTITNDPIDKNILTSTYGSVKKLPHSTLPDYVFQNINKWPNHVAVECGITGRHYSYSQVQDNYKKFATSLTEYGLKPGNDLITVCLPNIPEYPIVFYGPLEAGLSISPISHFYTADEILYNLKNSSSKAIVCVKDNLNNVLTAKRKFMEDGGFDIPIICLHDYDGSSITLPTGVRAFKDFLKTEINHKLLDDIKDRIDLNANSFLPFSSGTTGLPKGVCLTHKTLTANLEQTEEPKELQIFDKATDDQQDCAIATVPLCHIYGANYIMGSALKNGAKLITLAKFSVNNFIKTLQNNKNISLQAVPTILSALGKNESVTSKDLVNLKKIVVGGAPIGPKDIEELWDKKCIPFINAYGLTESSPILSMAEHVKGKAVSLGKVIRGTQCKIIDKNGNSQGTGQQGEICFKGPQIMKGYFNRPEETQKTLVDGWLHTGDVGYYDKDGYIYIVDRIKQLIKVNGFPVSPAELEEVIKRHVAVKDCAVIGLKCDKTGEAPVAFIVPYKDKTINEDEIKKFVAERVSPYKRLAKVLIIDSITKNATGKILRKAMTEYAVDLLGHTVTY